MLRLRVHFTLYVRGAQVSLVQGWRPYAAPALYKVVHGYLTSRARSSR